MPTLELEFQVPLVRSQSGLVLALPHDEPCSYVEVLAEITITASMRTAYADEEVDWALTRLKVGFEKDWIKPGNIFFQPLARWLDQRHGVLIWDKVNAKVASARAAA